MIAKDQKLPESESVARSKEHPHKSKITKNHHHHPICKHCHGCHHLHVRLQSLHYYAMLSMNGVGASANTRGKYCTEGNCNFGIEAVSGLRFPPGRCVGQTYFWQRGKEIFLLLVLSPAPESVLNCGTLRQVRPRDPGSPKVPGEGSEVGRRGVCTNVQKRHRRTCV